MRLFLDQDAPRRAAALLRDAGVDAVHASEVGRSTADDRDIVGWCRTNGAVAVTLDADSHSLIALSGETAPSAIRIRIQGLAGPAVAAIISDVLESHGEALTAGAPITVQPGRLRVRHLPIARQPRP